MKKIISLILFTPTILISLGLHYISQSKAAHIDSSVSAASNPIIKELNQTVQSGTSDKNFSNSVAYSFDYGHKGLISSVGLEVPDTRDGRRFQQLIQYAKTHNLSSASMSEITQIVAEQFLGAEYKAGLLDRTSQETLVISLHNFDCLLFVETVLAIARNIAMQDFRYQTFTDGVTDLRYRNGLLNGYCSRLHYFSDWIDDNQKRSNVDNIIASLGGKSIKKTLNFMGTHRNSYPLMINNEANYNCILEREQNLLEQTIN